MDLDSDAEERTVEKQVQSLSIADKPAEKNPKPKQKKQPHPKKSKTKVTEEEKKAARLAFLAASKEKAAARSKKAKDELARLQQEITDVDSGASGSQITASLQTTTQSTADGSQSAASAPPTTQGTSGASQSQKRASEGPPDQEPPTKQVKFDLNPSRSPSVVPDESTDFSELPLASSRCEEILRFAFAWREGTLGTSHMPWTEFAEIQKGEVGLVLNDLSDDDLRNTLLYCLEASDAMRLRDSDTYYVGSLLGTSIYWQECFSRNSDDCHLLKKYHDVCKKARKVWRKTNARGTIDISIRPWVTTPASSLTVPSATIAHGKGLTVPAAPSTAKTRTLRPR